MLISCQVKKYFGLSKRHPIVTIDVMQLNILTLESQSGNLFWTIFYNPDHCDLLSNNPFIVDGNCLILSLLVKLMLESHVEISPDWLSYFLRSLLQLIRTDGTLFRMFFSLSIDPEDFPGADCFMKTHRLGIDYYVNFLGGLGSNEFQLK